VEGQFRCRELFYRKDGGGDPVRDADGFHLLHQSSPEKKLVEGSEVGVRRISSHGPIPSIQKVYQIKLEKSFLSGCFEFGGGQEADVKS